MTRARDLSEIVNSTGLSVDTDTLVVDSANNRVGIGTDSPSALLQLEGSDGTPQLKFLRTGTIIGGIIRQTSNPYGLTYDAIDGNAGAPTHVFRTSVDGSSFTERLRIDASGNAGLGVTPEAWAAFNPVLRIKNAAAGGGGALASSGVDNFRMFANTYYDGAYKRLGAGLATIYEQASGAHIWYSNDSGLADSTFTPTPNMTLDASGNLGIGTSLPSEKITLAQSVPSTYTAGLSTLANPAGTHVRIENNSSVTDTFVGATFVPTNGAEQQQLAYMGAVSTGSGLAPDIVFGRRAASTYYVESMRINASGTLLMGQTSESSTDTGHIFNPIGVAFHVRDGGVPLVAVRKTDDGELVQFKKDTAVVGSIFSHSSGNMGIGTNDTGVLFAATSETLQPWNTSTNTVRDAAIDLGIDGGRFKDLHLSGGVYTNGDKFVYSYAGGVLGQVRSGIKFDGTNNQLEFYSNENEAMRIDPSRNLLVGIPTPTAKLVVNGQGAFGSEDASGNGIYLYVSGALSDDSYMSRNSAGSGTTTWYIGNQSITTSSDLRLKDNIVDSQRNAVEIINNLRVVDHTWNDPSDQSINNKNSRGVWTGLIAQEAVEHIPWLVNRPLEDVDENGNKNYWHMDYGYSVPLLIKAIQEQQEQIEQLKADIAAIKS